MTERQVRKATKEVAPAELETSARRAANKPKAANAAAPPVRRSAARTKADTPKVTPAAAKPASMSGPLPAIVTLKHLAEWAGYNHGVPKKQAIAMLTDLAAS
jgi:hypothetical protein